jgi:three-Cys-motif partner protein
MRKFGGSWSETKLDCVENYARSYLNVMQNQDRWTLDYVDAFAGRGKQALKKGQGDVGEILGVESFFGNESDRADTEEFLVGSAIRALHASIKSVRSFDRFIFIDADKPSCNELETFVMSEFPQAQEKVKVICGDANTALDDYITKTDWTLTRALVFLDPYGLEVSWDLIERLAETRACDVWYLFPLGGVIRMMTNNGQIQKTWRDRLDRVFGTNAWYEEFYRPSLQQSLFDEDQDQLYKNASPSHVVDFVRKRLSTTFKAVSNAGILRNGKGAPLFALLLGVSNPSKKAQIAALRIANHLVKDLSS